MQITFIVKVTVKPIQPQGREDFKINDGQDMIPYLSDKIHDTLDNAYKDNAKVSKVFVTHPKK